MANTINEADAKAAAAKKKVDEATKKADAKAAAAKKKVDEATKKADAKAAAELKSLQDENASLKASIEDAKEKPAVVKEVKLVDVELDRPMITNGVALGWETVDGKPKFTGKVVGVTEAVAQDLEDRMKVARASDEARLVNNGKSIDAAPGGISVGGA